MYIKLPEGMDFSTEFDTYIIAFCPDTDSWFVTNKRFFYYEYPEIEFKTEQEGINYLKRNPKTFYQIEIDMKVYRPSFNKNGIWVENINKLIKIEEEEK